MESFVSIFERAAQRKGGEQALEELLPLLPKTKSARQLAKIADSAMLAEMTKCVFRSGFVWKIIENKWAGFEQAFNQFDVTRCAMLSDEEIEQLQSNTNIVRHGKKIQSVRANAQYLLEIRSEHGSYGKFLAAWPEDDFVKLWSHLKKRGGRLGGQTGRYFLRFIGRDTPMFSTDVVQALMNARVVEKEPTSQRDLLATQDAFNGWREESGRSYCQLSRILACSVP
ncbi:MAG: 3-methyladenine DNA glycosylase [Gammaproteobacteria bacterium]|nr:3-methyladenine DNA glycosylase [Gammaproteobacteria bacterium]